MTDIHTLAVPLRKSWDSAQEGAGIEVCKVMVTQTDMLTCDGIRAECVCVCAGADVELLAVPQL